MELNLMREQNVLKANGFLAAIVFLAATGFAVYNFYTNVFDKLPEVDVGKTAISVGILFIVFVLSTGFTVVQPNQAYVYTLFGKYIGVIKQSGFWLTVPFTVRRHVSLRVLNFNSDKLKVNDLEGNPIEIAAVVVYKVVNSAKAVFDVEDYKQFVHIQSETGIRHVASQYPYDNFNDADEISLRQHSDEVCEELKQDLQKRFELAGVEILDARIMHLAYSNEIASAMLQRQQAKAVLAARQTIVLGAVSMVKDAIQQLSEQKVVELDEEKKAQMVNNLLVAIVSEKGTQPVMNNGTIY